MNIDEQALLSEHRWVNKQEKRFVDSTRRFSLLYGLFLSPCVIPRPPFLREAFGIRSGCAPSPCATHIHPPRDYPQAAPVVLYSSFNSPIFCPYSFKIALVLKKSFPKVLPLSQKCVPLHSLSEREAQATSEWIFDRLRTANKTRQR